MENISDYVREHHPHLRTQTMRKLYRTTDASPKRVRLLFPLTPYAGVYRVGKQAIEDHANLSRGAGPELNNYRLKPAG